MIVTNEYILYMM